MLFRLGGSFIAVLYLTFLASRLVPSLEASPVAILGIALMLYVLVAGWILLRLRRGLNPAGSASQRRADYPPWPKLPMVDVVTVLGGLTGLGAMLAPPTIISESFRILLLAVFCLLAAAMAILTIVRMIRSGHVPSRFHYRGVARQTEPGQFWASAIVVGAMAGLFFFAGLSFAILWISRLRA